MTNKDHIFAFYTISILMKKNKLNWKNKIKYFSDLPTLILSMLPETDIYFFYLTFAVLR